MQRQFLYHTYCMQRYTGRGRENEWVCVWVWCLCMYPVVWNLGLVTYTRPLGTRAPGIPTSPVRDHAHLCTYAHIASSTVLNERASQRLTLLHLLGLNLLTKTSCSHSTDLMVFHCEIQRSMPSLVWLQTGEIKTQPYTVKYIMTYGYLNIKF